MINKILYKNFCLTFGLVISLFTKLTNVERSRNLNSEKLDKEKRVVIIGPALVLMHAWVALWES